MSSVYTTFGEEGAKMTRKKMSRESETVATTSRRRADDDDTRDMQETPKQMRKWTPTSTTSSMSSAVRSAFFFHIPNTNSRPTEQLVTLHIPSSLYSLPSHAHSTTTSGNLMPSILRGKNVNPSYGSSCS